MDRQLKYDRTTTTIKPKTLTDKTNDLSPFKFTLSDEDIKAYKKLGNLMMDIAKTGGEAMARVIGNTYPGNFGVGTDEACRMVGRISSKPTKDINKEFIEKTMVNYRTLTQVMLIDPYYFSFVHPNNPYDPLNINIDKEKK